jgi:tetratricopeptide (TPR) repeat protein
MIMKHKNSVVKMLVSHASIALATWVLSILSVSANPTPPPPPKPLNTNTTTSPPASSGDSILEPANNSSSSSASETPTSPPADSSPVRAEPAPQPGPEAVPTSPPADSSPVRAEPALQPESEVLPTQSFSQEAAETEMAEPLTVKEQQLKNSIQTEVDRTLGRNNTFFYGLFAVILIMIGGTWIFLWLLRQNLTKIVVDELKQKIGGELKAEIGQEIKAEIEAEFVETLAQRNQSSALATSPKGIAPLTAQPEAKSTDNSTQINELISMAVATQSLLNETRSALEDSRKLHERINQPIQEIFGLYFKQATQLLQEGQYEDAIEMYDKSLQTNPDFYDAWLGRGIAFTRLQQYETAIGCYNKALQLNSDHPEPWYEKARCYAVKGDVDLVIDNLQRAINLNSNLKETVAQDPDFAILRDDESFRELTQG